MRTVTLTITDSADPFGPPNVEQSFTSHYAARAELIRLANVGWSRVVVKSVRDDGFDYTLFDGDEVIGTASITYVPYDCPLCGVVHKY